MVDLFAFRWYNYLGEQADVKSVFGADNLLNLLLGSQTNGTSFI